MPFWAPLLTMLTLTATPHVAYAPAKVTLVARHPFTEGDEELELSIWLGEELVTRSQRPLTKGTLPVQTLTATLREPGDYLAKVVVYTARGQAGAKTTRIHLE